MNKLCEEALTSLEATTKQLEKDVQDSITYANLLIANCAGHQNGCLEIANHLKEVQLILRKISINTDKIKTNSTTNHEQERNEINRRKNSVNRGTRTSSMKYLAQWEKVVEAQLAQNDITTEEEPILLPKPVIKKRVRQFERKDSKRISSTAEFFLDGGKMKPLLIENTINEEDNGNVEECENNGCQENVTYKKYIDEKPQKKEKRDHFKPKIVEVLVKILNTAKFS